MLLTCCCCCCCCLFCCFCSFCRRCCCCGCFWYCYRCCYYCYCYEYCCRCYCYCFCCYLCRGWYSCSCYCCCDAIRLIPLNLHRPNDRFFPKLIQGEAGACRQRDQMKQLQTITRRNLAFARLCFSERGIYAVGFPHQASSTGWGEAGALGWKRRQPDPNLNLPHPSAADTWLSFGLQGARRGCSRNGVAVPRAGSGRAELMGFGDWGRSVACCPSVYV